LFKKAEFKLDLNLLNLKIHIGGPLELERGFFLHSAEYNKNLLFKLENSELAVSSNIEILKEMKERFFEVSYREYDRIQGKDRQSRSDRS
jgi:putative AlgH/UPF0301 family transcriptional regulator